MAAPKGVVLLAAGSGSRLSPLTDRCHKSLLPVAKHPALKWIIDRILAAGVEDVVIVTGHRRYDIESFVQKFYTNKVRSIANNHYKKDINIFSVEIGVNQLHDASAGYMIIETDLVIEPQGWDVILDVGDRSRSFWVTHNQYSAALTGGTLCAEADGRVTNLLYRPQYDPACKGWKKLLGILYVGSAEVTADRKLRRAAIDETISQYYMMPWVNNLAQLPCFAHDLGDVYAISYNDIAAYRSADEEYTRILNGLGLKYAD